MEILEISKKNIISNFQNFGNFGNFEMFEISKKNPKSYLQLVSQKTSGLYCKWLVFGTGPLHLLLPGTAGSTSPKRPSRATRWKRVKVIVDGCQCSSQRVLQHWKGTNCSIHHSGGGRRRGVFGTSREGYRRKISLSYEFRIKNDFS